MQEVKPSSEVWLPIIFIPSWADPRVVVTAVWHQILNPGPSVTSHKGKEEDVYGGRVRREGAQALQGWP